MDSDMKIITEYISVGTKGDTDIVDITEHAAAILSKSSLSAGTITFFVSGSTAGLTTVEYEPGLLKDLPEAFELIAPKGKTYFHDATWHDGNGHSHVRASLLGFWSFHLMMGRCYWEHGNKLYLLILIIDLVKEK